MIDMMDLKGASIRPLAFATAKTAIAVSFPDKSLEFSRESVTIGQHADPALPVGIVGAGLSFGHQMFTFLSMMFPVKRIIATRPILCLIGCGNICQPRSRAVSNRLANTFFARIGSLVLCSTCCCSLKKTFRWNRYTSEWAWRAWYSFIQGWLSLYKSCLFTIWIMPMSILSWFTLFVDRRNKNAASTLTWNLRHRIYQSLPFRPMPSLSFCR